MALDDIEPAKTTDEVYDLGVPRFPEDSAVYIVETESGYKAMDHSTFKDMFGSHGQSEIEQLIKDEINQVITLAVPTSSKNYLPVDEVVLGVNDLFYHHESVFSDLDLEETGEYIMENLCLEDELPKGSIIKIFQKV